MKKTNDDYNIPKERTVLYYVGKIVTVIGLLLFFSVFVEVAFHIQRAAAHEPSDPSGFMFMRGVIGMGLMIIGTICQGIGARGLAGSGILIDPQRGRRELRPWSKMAGGMVHDALEEVEFVQRNDDGREAEFVKVRCRSCRALNDENAKFCDQCGQPL